MTLREFKAWLEGYEESFGYSGPSSTQWAKVKERLESVEAWPVYPQTAPSYPTPAWIPPIISTCNASGGIVPSAQYLIGEHGAESISPPEAPQ